MRLLPIFALALVGLLAACAEPPPNSAGACQLERRGVFQLDFVRGMPIIAVTMDGAPATLLFDTGASTTTLSAVAAERLKLLRNGNMRITSHGVGGRTDAIAASVGNFDLAGASLPNRTVMVLPFELRGFGASPPDGLLGFDVFSLFDTEVDLKTGQGVFYRARNCPSAPAPWPLASNRFAIPEETPSGKLHIDVELDGKRLVATVDTGTGRSLLSAAAATALGITEAELAAARSIDGHGVAPNDAKMRVHRFKRLRIGNQIVNNPELPIVELPPGAGDMLIGMNFLATRKLWISLSSRTLHISAAQPRQ